MQSLQSHLPLGLFEAQGAIVRLRLQTQEASRGYGKQPSALA
jgi:hypothetical protein